MIKYIQILIVSSFMLADSPDWEVNPGNFEYAAYLVAGIIYNGEGINIAEEEDLFAAFDENGDIRGIAVQLDPPFGPYLGQILYEMTIYTNNQDDVITFKYYDASEDNIIDIQKLYRISINEQLGDIFNPVVYPTTLPEVFNYSQSTAQAFYFFSSVTINGIQIDSDDWVGAFNEDICVGARHWGDCVANACDVPVMGSDGNSWTAGYMVNGDYPEFQIYDASDNAYYSATPSQNTSWVPNLMTDPYTLEASIAIYGCTDPDYCNYNQYANEDDGSCNYVCQGCMDSGLEPGFPGYDIYGAAACNYDLNATVDDGSCRYPCDAPNGCEEGNINYDCDGICITEGDHLNEYGLDCAFECGGNSVIDDCNLCTGFENYEANSCHDCGGIANGDASLDECGNCLCGQNGNYSDSSSCQEEPACFQDCTGQYCVEGSEGCLVGTGSQCDNDLDGCDGCGTCGGNNNNVEDCSCNSGVRDCAGICPDEEGFGSEFDDCGICNGSEGYLSGSCYDCFGEPNGDNVEDNCGICDNDSSNDCIQDCHGDWGGAAEIDICGLCGGLGVSGGLDCNGECCTDTNENPVCDYYGIIDYTLDCFNICGGLSLPGFVCENGTIVCQPTDCTLDNTIKEFPDKIGISRVFPNPFNPIVEINFEVTHFSKVIIRIFDLQGNEIDKLINEHLNPGQYHVTWNASDFSSGLYFAEMILQSNSSNHFRDVKKMLYIK